MVRAGKSDRATQVAQRARCRIDDALAVILSEVGKFDQAIQTAQKIKYGLLRVFVLEKIAVMLAKVDEFDQAIQIAQKTEIKKVNTLIRIAKALVEMGKFNQAFQVSQKIDGIPCLQVLAFLISEMKKAGLIKSED